MPSREFEAAYEGHCFDCGEMIAVGQHVVYDDDGDLVHAGCYNDPTSFDPNGDDDVRYVKFVEVKERDDRKPCEACHLVHAGECF